MSKMAIAYNLRKKKNKHDKKENAEKGVHKSAFHYPIDKEDEGMSYAGKSVRNAKNSGDEKHPDNYQAHKAHTAVLKELQEMPNPKLKGMAEGGKTDFDKGKASLSKAFGYNPEPKSAPEQEPEKSKAKYEVLKPGSTAYADGGKVGGAKTSTTGNKTKTGGSNPGGASTGGAGTVTITTGKIPPKGINISNVGGKTDASNPGGMDPSDEDDAMMAKGGCVNCGYAEGGEVEDHKMLKPSLGEASYRESSEEQAAKAKELGDFVDRLMEKRAMYSQGGKVANDTGTGEEADEMPNQFDDLVLRDDLESDYDGSNAGDYLGNSQEDEDRKDIVSRIMASRRKKDRNPRPA